MRSILLPVFLLLSHASFTQNNDTVKYWHGKERNIHYRPEGNDFVCADPKLRFNRALYGTNTGFRVEAGDLPEFAMYMPGMGGNLQFNIVNGKKTKLLIKADSIKTIYRPGSMLYEIKDALLGKGKLFITILALSKAEGLVAQIRSEGIKDSVQLLWRYGGASGKKFSRDGDIGADPESSFYMTPESAADNDIELLPGKFILTYGWQRDLTDAERYEIQNKPQGILKGELGKISKSITGYDPSGSLSVYLDIDFLFSPEKAKDSISIVVPYCVAGTVLLKNEPHYFLFHNSATPVTKTAEQEFNDAEAARKGLADRIKINTPDKYLNTLGGALSVAADAIWEEPTYLHGAVAWRMRLPGWRGPYVADPLGWHDRARKHFDAYARSQLTTSATNGVVMDTTLNLARHIEKVGTQLFSEGYITRNPNGYVGAHHYDMNLVFVDQLFDHFNWTGDTSYVRTMWPLIKRHLAWEKRNFDMDGDGLYDAYAAIWASDALQYSGGGVTHSSAYNYRANKLAGELAKLIHEDGTAYAIEAKKIYKAVQKNLWLSKQGSFAEYKDLLGKKLVHPSPGLWTSYLAIDSKLPDAFQSYQCLRYIDENIPHIPVQAKGLDEKDLYLLSTTNWQPYTWSLNNVALAENLHTSLAYWQGNRSDEAYKLWRSSIIESMYLSASPGGFEQLSFYDAIRGELYRDFADPVGIAARTLIEGLFGIQPDALHDTLMIKPGFPSSWDAASLTTPDIFFDLKRKDDTDNYIIKQSFSKQLSLKLILEARKDGIGSVIVNGKSVKWKLIPSPVGKPMFEVDIPGSEQYNIMVSYKGRYISYLDYEPIIYGDLTIHSNGLQILSVYDPSKIMSRHSLKPNVLTGEIPWPQEGGDMFVQVKQGSFTWWEPVHFYVIRNPRIYLPPDPSDPETKKKLEKIQLDKYFNDKVTNIFKQQYLSPRPKSPTLQLPAQGIGNWCYPLTTATIDDSGTRKNAGMANEIVSSKGVPFKTPSDTSLKNIVFTSQWDNYPDSVTVALSGSASVIYLLMAGTTNPMQSQLMNGDITIHYTDGSVETMGLHNPANWWPVEQDYYTDENAFKFKYVTPDRLYLKEGKFAPAGSYHYGTIKGFTNMAIDGGAATVVEWPLNSSKKLHSLTVHAIANDVVIGLMAVTLLR